MLVAQNPGFPAAFEGRCMPQWNKLFHMWVQALQEVGALSRSIAQIEAGLIRSIQFRKPIQIA